ncbi:MAG: carnitine dehydratase [Alphaproteobacteria bacterium]|nr:carnitine dehydratase [Alphaproteobacteria bacterium]
MNGLLDGIRVLDFTTMMAGPYCTRQLADLGAEIIKIEAPGGEQNRRAAPIRDGESAVYGHLNCGKHSLAIDLKNPEGLRIALDLAAQCDVVVENARPGVMERLGLDFGAIREVRPDIVYCSISGFGQTGPAAHNPAYAPVVQAASGYEMAILEQQPEMSRPGFIGVFLADVMAAVQAFGAINAALFARERGGGGRYIDVSLMESVIWLLVYEIQLAQNPVETPRGYYRPVKASDGFVMVAPGGQQTFENMAHAMGHPEWIEDPRFLTHPDRNRNYADLMALVEVWTSTRSAEKCEQVLMAGKVPCARYRAVEELFDDPQLVHRGAFATVSDGAGAYRVPNPPFAVDNASVGARDWIARFGSSAPEVLQSLLEMDADTVEQLFERGVLFRQQS